jgi:hypothetical protein
MATNRLNKHVYARNDSAMSSCVCNLCISFHSDLDYGDAQSQLDLPAPIYTFVANFFQTPFNGGSTGISTEVPVMKSMSL